MPYADPEKQKEAQARWYRKKYEQDRKFRAAEAERKAAWLQTPEGRLSNAESSARFRRLGGDAGEGGHQERGGRKGGSGGVGAKAGGATGKRVQGSGAKGAEGRGALKKNGPVKDGVSKKGGGLMKGDASVKPSAMEYDESKPKEVKAFARMVQTLQRTGVKFVVGRKGKRLTLRVGE
jgi:hypothetical protein